MFTPRDFQGSCWDERELNMGRSRHGDESPMSFFSFQDVMMCTIGVTIVITMVLILQIGALPRGLDLIEEDSYTSDRFRPAVKEAKP